MYLFQILSFSEIHFSKFVQPTSKLTGIFLDPLGFHLLMAFTARAKIVDAGPELVYLHRRSVKPKSVSKSRNYEVTEVGWNMENTSETTTGPILLGTSQGHILETEMEADSDKMFTASQPYWRPVRYINLKSLLLEYELVPFEDYSLFESMHNFSYNTLVHDDRQHSNPHKLIAP